MARGTLVFISKSGRVYQSIAFNSLMSYNANGKYAHDVMKKVETKEQFANVVEEFNKSYYKYQGLDEYIFPCTPKHKYLNAFKNDDYFKYWFSDYLYIKNASDKDIIIEIGHGKSVTLTSNYVTMLYFGTLAEESK